MFILALNALKSKVLLTVSIRLFISILLKLSISFIIVHTKIIWMQWCYLCCLGDNHVWGAFSSLSDVCILDNLSCTSYYSLGCTSSRTDACIVSLLSDLWIHPDTLDTRVCLSIDWQYPYLWSHLMGLPIKEFGVCMPFSSQSDLGRVMLILSFIIPGITKSTIYSLVIPLKVTKEDPLSRPTDASTMN